jgi:hypothetical protein
MTRIDKIGNPEPDKKRFRPVKAVSVDNPNGGFNCEGINYPVDTESSQLPQEDLDKMNGMTLEQARAFKAQWLIDNGYKIPDNRQ